VHEKRVDLIEIFLFWSYLKVSLFLNKCFFNRYGAKIRFPHALVMTFLFRDGLLKDKLRYILKATVQHASNLAKFSFVYKSLTTIFGKMNDSKYDIRHTKKQPTSVVISAAIAGYLVFGDNNPINTQINMYLMSRTLFGFARLLADNGYLPSRDTSKGGTDYFPVFAACVWACGLWLFEFHRHTLQRSLQASMTYLYEDSNVWNNFWDFLVYNRLP